MCVFTKRPGYKDIKKRIWLDCSFFPNSPSAENEKIRGALPMLSFADGIETAIEDHIACILFVK